MHDSYLLSPPASQGALLQLQCKLIWKRTRKPLPQHRSELQVHSPYPTALSTGKIPLPLPHASNEQANRDTPPRLKCNPGILPGRSKHRGRKRNLPSFLHLEHRGWRTPCPFKAEPRVSLAAASMGMGGEILPTSSLPQVCCCLEDPGLFSGWAEYSPHPVYLWRKVGGGDFLSPPGCLLLPRRPQAVLVWDRVVPAPCMHGEGGMGISLLLVLEAAGDGERILG